MFMKLRGLFGTASLQETGLLANAFVRTACVKVERCRQVWEDTNPLYSSSRLASFMYSEAARKMGYELDEEFFRIQLRAAEELVERVQDDVPAATILNVLPEAMRTRRIARALEQHEAPKLAALCAG